MEKRVLGRTGMAVTVLGFGAAEIGYENVPFDQVERLLHAALDAGLNLIDTAECYPGSEEMIGRAVSGRRKDYFLFTKCGHASGLDLPDWDPRMLEMQIDRSLQRLRVDHVDLVQLHSCSQAVLERGDAIGVLQKAREAGKTRFIGYSGDGQNAVYAIESGVFDTLQTSVSIADGEAIDLTLPLAVRQGMGVIAKRPIANAAWKTGSKPGNPYHQEYWRRLEVLQYDFLDGDLSQSISKALRFTLAQPGVATAIVGTTQPGRWASNARLLEAGPLGTAEIQAIRERWRAKAAPDWVGQT
ncbi:MAG: aldo/keto reductase [Acidobacteriia bacterium]|nr:aldo/keto reductase [Terriglobia bacterium]